MAYTFDKEDLKDSLRKWCGPVVASALTNGPDAMRPKWEQRLAVYQGDKRYAGQRLFDNVEPYPYDVMGPVVRNLKDAIMASLVGPGTYCQALPIGKTSQEAADVLEQGVQTIVDKAGLERKLDLRLLNMCLCGVGFLRVRMDEQGLQIDGINPGDMVVACAKGEPLSKAGMVGHRFFLPYWEFCQRVEAGLYPMVEEEGQGLRKYIGRDEKTGVSEDHPATEQPDSDKDDFEDVRLFELLCRISVKGMESETGWYRAVYSEEADSVLLCEPYPYPDPWYFDLRLHDEETFWPLESAASRIMPQCIHIAQMMNLAVVGHMAAVTNTYGVSGAGNYLAKKVHSQRLGQIIPLPYDAKVQELPFHFDGSALLALIEFELNFINKSAGVSESAISGESLGSETATEVADMAENRQKNQGARSRFTGDFVEPIFAFVHKLCVWHQGVVKSVYGLDLDERFIPALKARVKWQMTARSPDSTGTVQVAKAEKMVGFASIEGSPIHLGRAIEAAAQSLNFTDYQRIKKTPEEIEAERQAEQQKAQIEMAIAMAGQKPPAMAAGKDGQGRASRNGAVA